VTADSSAEIGAYPDANSGANSSAAALNERHGLADTLEFREGPGGLLFTEINNAQARASVCLQGGQVLLWQPHTQSNPVLWLSGAARYAAGNAIRGGIPVCWPWFGSPAAPPGGDAPAGPAHGFARTQSWRVDGTQAIGSGQTCLRLGLADNPATRALWPGAFALELQITIGDTLDLVLRTRNTGAAPMVITEALHTYFRIGDIASTSVEGLAGVAYFDAAEPAAGVREGRRTQDGAVRFGGEVDRVYDSGAPCWIDDLILQRRIHIAASGSASTVVWNPWDAKAQRLGDLGDGAWRQMVCVESGNARDRAVSVAPGASHELAVRYRVES
jgi:D-hexose-6-phosphate mutarotase